MRIDIITVLPELLESPFNHSIIKRAKAKGLVEINIINLRDFTTDKYKSVDDYAFGGGAGMVMMIEPVYKAIEKLKSEREYDDIIYTSPDGEKFSQKMANKLSMQKNLIILAGHYKGVDQRIRDHLVTKEISVGDYVLSGGELPAAVITDAIIRLIPGAISDEQSALSDSSRTICLLHLYLPGHTNLTAGKYLIFFYRGMQQRLINGGMNNLLKERKDYARTLQMMNKNEYRFKD
jgi:tRNA (guanine37-N1)-methyltransferase